MIIYLSNEIFYLITNGKSLSNVNEQSIPSSGLG
jgi:hypothetical protein